MPTPTQTPYTPPLYTTPGMGISSGNVTIAAVHLQCWHGPLRCNAVSICLRARAAVSRWHRLALARAWQGSVRGAAMPQHHAHGVPHAATKHTARRRNGRQQRQLPSRSVQYRLPAANRSARSLKARHWLAQQQAHPRPKPRDRACSPWATCCKTRSVQGKVGLTVGSISTTDEGTPATTFPGAAARPMAR